MNRFLQPSSIDEASISYWDISNEQIIFLLSPSSVNSLLQLDWNLTYDWKNPKLPVELWLLVVKMIFFCQSILRRFTMFIGSESRKGKLFEMWIYLTPINFYTFFLVPQTTRNLLSLTLRKGARESLCSSTRMFMLWSFFRRWQRVMRMWWRWLKAYLSHSR